LPIIEGFATADATDAHVKRFDTLSYTTMGRTGLRCSQAGFGCYRIADGIDSHRDALQRALGGGINLIDTSANYADGESETLVGNVLTDAIESGSLNRAAIIVVTKGGYLQGRNYDVSQARKAQGQPFPDLVPYADGLEHCIHPEFLEDQVTRSLERLNLATLDFFLLHNPEYYLSWAVSKQGMEQDAANAAYEGRILNAFQHLEQEVARGRIRYYGISSNTFPEPSDRPDFTCLQRILDVASSVDPEHHFAMIQFPMNLLESGAVLNRNQPDGATLLTTAIKAGLGTLVNRPLNALAADGLLRLSDVRLPGRYSPEGIVKAIQALVSSENALAREMLPNLDLSEALRTRIETQIRIGPMLLQQHRDFRSYDYWRQILTSQLLPRVNGVLAYLDQQAFRHNLRAWAEAHGRYLATALEAVASLYAPAAAERAEALKQMVAEADPDWEGHGTLSQMAIRTLRTTRGISSVLVGMRQPRYVDDVLQELHRPRPTTPRHTGWTHIKDEIDGLGLSVDHY
jgi:aryl-alcohol dehydrogenase-like predicted oxidoreductase